MKKARIALIGFLSLVMMCCIAFVACSEHDKPDEPQPNKYAINWLPDEYIDHISVKGYNELPTELEEGTEVIFTVTPKEDYLVNDVTPHSAIEAQEDGSYKFMVDGELNVKITSKEAVNEYTVTGVKFETEGDKIYFVISGTYEGAVKYASEKDIYFCLDDNVYIWTGSWWDSNRGDRDECWESSQGDGGGYSSHALPQDARTMIANADGTFEVKIDFTAVTCYWYSMRLSLGYNADKTDFDAADFKADWTEEAFDTDYQCNGKNYRLHYNPNSWDWRGNNISVIVTEITEGTAS